MIDKCKKSSMLCQIFIWIFPMLFLIDNILGFNGYQFTIAGQSIRIILFCISVVVLLGYSLIVLIKDKIAIFPTASAKTTLWKILCPFDYFVLFFVFANAIWATVIPLFIRGEMIFSLKDFSTILVLVLYFPIAFLIRTNGLSLNILKKSIYILLFILALWHCVMYIGETIHPGFYEGYYDFIDFISFGTAVRSNVVYGFGIVRIIQTTSVFLLIGVFMAVENVLKKKWLHIIVLLVYTFAICITYTKSIWFGYVAGLVLYLIGSFIFEKSKKQRLHRVLVLCIAVLMIVVLNFSVFGNTVFERAFNVVRSEQSIQEMQEQLDEMVANGEDTNDIDNKIKDALGTQEANAMRSQQNGALIKKWKQSKWFGFGYGSYSEDCIRNEEFPYMYESTLPALAMKIGLTGCLVWALFICAATVFAAKTFWKEEKDKLFLWLGIAISYAMAVQTNPLLFTFTGMSILLFLLLYPQRKLGD